MIKTKKDLHLLRKFGHFFPAFVCAFVLIFNIVEIDLMRDIFIKIFVIGLLFDRLRLTNKNFNDKVIKIFKKFMREEELMSPSGLPAYVGAIALVFTFFPEKVAILSILQLAMVDPLASVGGVLFREHRYNVIFDNKKSLIGYFSGVIVSIIISVLLLVFWGISFPVAFTFAFFSGIFISLAELKPPFNLNDNWTVPLGAAGIFSIINLIMEIL